MSKKDKRPKPAPPNPNGKNRGQVKVVAVGSTQQAAPSVKETVWRCSFGGCNRIQFIGTLGVGTDFEIQCPSCGGYLRMVVTAAI